MAKGKFLSKIEMTDQSFSIRASEHAVERLTERNVDAYTATAAVIALGEAVLTDLQVTKDEAMIIDEDNGIAIVVGFRKHTCYIVTAMNKSRVFVKKGTRTYKLGDE